MCFFMMRISMSLPKKLLADFDEVLKERGYQSRSKGIRDALQDYIVTFRALINQNNFLTIVDGMWLKLG